MRVELTKKEVEETLTALEEFTSHLHENGMEDCTRCDLDTVDLVRRKLMYQLLKGVMRNERN